MVEIFKEYTGIQKVIKMSEGEEVVITFPGSPAATRSWTCPVGFEAVINLNIAVDEIPE